MSFLRPTAARVMPKPTTIRTFTTTPPRALARMTLIGRLAATPELTVTSTGRELVRYAVGTSSGPRDNRTTSWFRVVAFEDAGPRRELLLGLPKGALVAVDADSKLRTYDDETSGQRRTVLDLTQNKLDVLSRPRTDEAAQQDVGEVAMA